MKQPQPITMDEIPDDDGNRFPMPRTVKNSLEVEELLKRLQQMGKKPAAFMRMAVERQLDCVFPGEREKIRERLKSPKSA